MSHTPAGSNRSRPIDPMRSGPTGPNTEAGKQWLRPRGATFGRAPRIQTMRADAPAQPDRRLSCQGGCYVGVRKVIALEQQRLAGDFCQSICKAITKI